jgi:dipeptidyl aminopeptidase/acylaminoacyl peptidase
LAEKRVAPFGAWKSPITAELIVAETVVLREVAVDGRDVYWLEMRPSEGGRYVVVRRTADGRASDVTPPGFNARTTVHEYGGGSYLPADGVVYFSNFADQRLYRQAAGSEPQPLTPAADLRYADGMPDAKRGRLIYVREDHRDPSREAVNTIVGVDAEQGGEGDVLVGGNDFYSNPRLTGDGSRLAWLAWNHPNMPWDGSELWVADVDDEGSLRKPRRVAGGVKESIFQPEWSPDGSLYFISDRSGWWNLYRWNGEGVRPVWEAESEFGLPQWVFGMRTYAVTAGGEIVCSYEEEGQSKLAVVEADSERRREIHTPYSEITGLRTYENKAVFLGASPTEATAVVELDLDNGAIQVLRRSSNVEIADGYVSPAEAIEFPTEGGLTAHAFYYAPANKDYGAPDGERPPVLVISHGGPTGAASSQLNLSVQFWTSRGIAVVDVNYGGSTGHGREYRERLNDKWGIVDIDDCVNAALYLVRRGDVDGERLAIRGGSAGGYTTLAALAFRDVFKAGASYFGVSDLEALAKDTHKFESRYLDGLIGPYPERRDLYVERSPIHHVDGFKAPMIVLQGLEDKVVPPNQAEMIVEALRKKGIPVAYLPFEGEQHGFRRAETIKKALGGELYFYSRIFGFEPPDSAEPVEIENL